jgi:4-hydroxyacetophenone monooxygenase
MDDNDTGGLSPQLQRVVRAAAAEAIVAWSRNGEIALDESREGLLVRMLGVCVGDGPRCPGPRIAADLKSALHSEETTYEPVGTPAGFRVLIVGAGFSGF